VFDKAAENQLSELMVIGGAEIYRQAIDFADELIITHVHAEFPEADVFFPVISENWVLKESILPEKQAEFDFFFATYSKKII
jgi:dihydrofolate reductase